MRKNIIFFCRMCEKPYIVLVNEAKIRSIAKSSGGGIATVTTIHLSGPKPHIVKLHIDEHGAVRGDYYDTIDIPGVFAWSISEEAQKYVATMYTLAKGKREINLMQVPPTDNIEEIIKLYIGRTLGNFRIRKQHEKISIETDLDEIDALTKTVIEIILMKLVEKNKDRKYIVRYIGGNIEIATT